ncbi:hypothetical protein OQA88_4316 [Cercophora sp. LCS_1]
MTKYVKPTVKQLEEALATIDAQAKRIRELEEENRVLKLDRLASRHPHTNVRPPQTSPARKITGKEYMAQTESSKRHARNHTEGSNSQCGRQQHRPVTFFPDTQRCFTGFYDGGRLVERKEKEFVSCNFARATKASQARQNPFTFGWGYYLHRTTHHFVASDEGGERPEEFPEDRYWGNAGNTPATGDGDEPELEETDEQTKRWTQINAQHEELVKRTRLSTDFPPAAHININASAGQRLMRRAYFLALEAFDACATIHWPGLKAVHFPDGAGCLEINRERVTETFPNWLYNNAGPEIPLRYVTGPLRSLVVVRNFVAHPEITTVRQYDW